MGTPGTSITVEAPPGVRGLAIPLRAIVRATLEREGRRPGDIAVVLTGDAALRALNRRWRGIDRATDVLSFEYGPVAGEPGRKNPPRVSGKPAAERASRPRVAGDLVISLDRTFAQARRYRVTPGAELARLVIHGALHLAGLDHQRLADRRHMRAREDAALRACRQHVALLSRRMRASRDLPVVPGYSARRRDAEPR